MDSAEVGPAVFKDQVFVFASGQRPVLPLLYAPCSCLATKEFTVKLESLRGDQITNVKKSASLASFVKCNRHPCVLIELTV